MFTCLLVVLFVELTQEFFEHRTHAVIRQCRQYQAIGVALVLICQIDAGVGNAFYHRQQAVVVCQLTGLGVVLKVFQHVAHVLAIAVQILHEVVIEQVIVVGSTRLQAIQRPAAGVEVAELCNVLQGIFVNVFKAHFLLFFQLCLYSVLRRFQ